MADMEITLTVEERDMLRNGLDKLITGWSGPSSPLWAYPNKDRLKANIERAELLKKKLLAARTTASL